MKFKEVAATFDEIADESSRLIITELLAALLKKARPHDAATIAYFSLGNLNPVYVGTQFNFAQKSLVNVVARVAGISTAEVTRRLKSKGDLGLVLEDYHNPSLSHEMTVNQVAKELHKIHDTTGTGSQEIKEKMIVALLGQLDGPSAKYVIKIILGKLRLGFSDMTLLDAFSWMEVGDKSLRKRLENAYNVSADIGHVIETLKEGGIEAIDDMQVELGIPIRPAGAERLADAQAIIEKLGPCVAQPKLDGFRVQVHVWKKGAKTNVRFFSRNLTDMSDMFPDLAEAAKKLDVDSFIAEGEAIAIDEQTGTFRPFQETAKRRRKYDIDALARDLPLRLYLFDLLYLNGEELFNHTHTQRRKELLAVVKKSKDLPECVQVIEEKKIHDASELTAYFNENITSGLEGLVVKKPRSHYQPGKRNFNWIKLKRQDSGHLDDTIDCVILGYYSGYGKRASFGIGAFLVGVYNKKKDVFETIAKVGTGLKDEQWRELKKMCDGIAVKEKPKNVVCAKDLAVDTWVSPEIVCRVRADEITLSPVHTAGAKEGKLGYALRFPRIMAYRDDKSARDATTVKEVEHLYNLQYAHSEKASKDGGKSQKKAQRSIFGKRS